MAGLREKKKSRTQKAIIKAAWDLFLEKGFNNSTIDEIAERAEVSVGTIYNYYGSKRLILLAINERLTEDLLIKGEVIRKKTKGDPEEAVFELIWLYFSQAFAYDREFMREIMASIMTEYDSIAQEMFGLDLRLVGQISETLEGYQKQGLISRNIPIERASLLLYGTMMMPIFMFLFMEDVSKESLKTEIRENIRLVFMGWKPGKE